MWKSFTSKSGVYRRSALLALSAAWHVLVFWSHEMTSLFSPAYAAETPYLALVTLVPALALSIGMQVDRPGKADATVAKSDSARCPSHGRSVCDGWNGLWPETNAG